MKLFMPVEFYSGAGCVSANAGVFSRYGKKCLIVTGKNSALLSGALADVISALSSEGIAYEIFDGITQNPLFSDCVRAGESAAQAGAEFIVGIGGGSPLDAAKAICVTAANPGISEDDFYSFKWKNGALRSVLVATAAGTGSEVTEVAVLTDSKKRKHSVHAPGLYAAAAFGDPRYTYSLGEYYTVSTALDAFAHAAESYFTKKADDISRAFSVSAAGMIIPELEKLSFPLSEDARERLYNGSVLGGLAINTTGTAFPHNVGYYLTENYGVPHGIACAVFADSLLEYEEKENPAYTKEFYERTGLTRERLFAVLEKCVEKPDIRLSAAEIKTALPRWENNGTVKNTLGSVDTAFIEKMLTEKFGE